VFVVVVVSARTETTAPIATSAATSESVRMDRDALIMAAKVIPGGIHRREPNWTA
jgi:hypothetical protein